MEPHDALDIGVLPKRASSMTRYLFVVGLCLYVGVVWYLGWQKVRDELFSVRPSYILATAALILAGTWLRAWKWRYVLGPGHSAVGLFFLSKATGNWSPGRLGEFAPMALKRHRTPRIGAWILLDRLLEIAVTLVLGLYGLAVVNLLSRGAYLIVLAAVVGASVLSMYLVTRRSFFLWIAGRSSEDSWVHRFAMLFAAGSEELFRFGRKMPLAILITVATKCGDLWAVCLLFLGFGYRPGFALVAAAKCALAIVSFLPLTPAATGVPHVTQGWLMNRAADIPLEGLTAAIGMEVVVVSVTFWTSFGLAASFIKDAVK